MRCSALIRFVTTLLIVPALLPAFATAAPVAQTAGAGSKYRIVAGASSANSNNAITAFDGDRQTAWRTIGSGTPRSAWVLFDLGQEQPIGSVRWMFAQRGFADSFSIQASRDRVAWRLLGQEGNAPERTWRQLATNGSARYVRFVFRNPRDDETLGSLAEVEVWSPAATPAPTPPAPQGDPIALGVYTPGAPKDGAAIDAFAEKIGRMPAVIGMHKAWGDNQYWASFEPEILDILENRGAMPYITWEPWVPNGGVEQPTYRLANIARGDFDDYVDAWATAAAADGRPFYLNFAHEMNGNWYPWGASANGNSPADYIAAWRHVHSRFAAAGADNVRWVWCPNVADGPYVPMRELYPGDAYVDWVALDGYNWGGERWRTFAEIFGPSYDTLTALTDKPIIVGETGSVELGGDKAVWIRDGFQTQLPVKFPRIRAVLWFNHDASVGNRDWRVDTSAASLQAFRESVQTPYLQGTLP